MSTHVPGTGQLLVTAREERLAREVVGQLQGGVRLEVTVESGDARTLPHEVIELIGQVLAAVASGRPVSISAIPEVLTTSAAAALLGVSRPTLMKLLSDGTIPSHRVGTHTRVKSSDVMQALRARRERERAAFAALLEAEGDEVN